MSSMEANHTTDSGSALRPTRQTADPVVTRIKFDRELAYFNEQELHYQQRGIFLRRVEFPQLVFIFATPRIRPAALLFGVRFDFTNYDVEAISIEFIDPLTEVPLRREELPVQFLRESPPVEMSFQLSDGKVQHQLVPTKPVDLIQYHAPHNKPFLCIPGVREYHNHSAHSNDPWRLRLHQGEGSLGFLLSKLHKYGTGPVTAYVPNFVPVTDENGQLQLVNGQVPLTMQGVGFEVNVPK